MIASWVVSDAIFCTLLLQPRWYGFQPATVGGQVFTIFYALLAIPIGTDCMALLKWQSMDLQYYIQ